MDTHLLNNKQTEKVFVKVVDSQLIDDIYQSMAMTPPIGLKLIDKEQKRIFFAAHSKNEYVGVLAIKLSTANNAHIDWVAIKQNDHFHIICEKLLRATEIYCYDLKYSSITIETISPDAIHAHKPYYELYTQLGYKPLFVIKAPESQDSMIYLQKVLSLNDFIFIDLTHALTSDIPHWGIDVGFKYNARFIQGTETSSGLKFRVQRLEMSAGIGTHMDAPSHCFENGPAIDAIPMQSLITACRMIDVSSKAHDRYSISVADIQQFEEEYGIIPKGSFVILYTGWDQRWPEPEKYRNDKVFPSISIAAAEHLLARDIVGLGIDTLSPDAFGSDFPVHALILGAGKYMIENVANAKLLDPIGSYTFALPIKIKDGTEAPMRLIGMKRNIARFSYPIKYA